MQFVGAMNQSPEEIIVTGRQDRLVTACMGQLFVTIREEYSAYMEDRFFLPIVKAFQDMQKNYEVVQFKQIYTQVCLNLGATPEHAELGFAPCPYKGVEKNMKGLIRSWVEERSPHSRQRYFRGGSRVIGRQDERPLLFVNVILGQNNAANEWRPYTHARGRGWKFDPQAAEMAEMPSNDVLNAAAAIYRKKGMQGRARVKHTRDVQVKGTSFTVKGNGMMYSI
jgi:hypothetical protein